MSTVTRYQEHPVVGPLAEHLECFWTARSAPGAPGGRGDPGAAESNGRVLPDACLDVLFDLSERPVRPHGLRSYVVGAMTGAIAVEYPGEVDILGVRFRPGRAAAFLHLPLGEMTDRAVDVGALGAGWEATARRIHAAAPAERIGLLEAALAIRLRSAAMAERLVAGAWSRIVATDGAIPVRGLAGELGVGERRLQRLFHDRFGLTPKDAARVARFRAALRRLRRHPGRELGRIALESGYYDQPHFNREFRRLAGLSPERWLAERRLRLAADVAPVPDAGAVPRIPPAS